MFAGKIRPYIPNFAFFTFTIMSEETNISLDNLSVYKMSKESTFIKNTLDFAEFKEEIILDIRNPSHFMYGYNPKIISEILFAISNGDEIEFGTQYGNQVFTICDFLGIKMERKINIPRKLEEYSKQEIMNFNQTFVQKCILEEIAKTDNLNSIPLLRKLAFIIISDRFLIPSDLMSNIFSKILTVKFNDYYDTYITKWSLFSKISKNKFKYILESLDDNTLFTIYNFLGIVKDELFGVYIECLKERLEKAYDKGTVHFISKQPVPFKIHVHEDRYIAHQLLSRKSKPLLIHENKIKEVFAHSFEKRKDIICNICISLLIK